MTEADREDTGTSTHSSASMCRRRREPSLYFDPTAVSARSGAFSGSALLAYKINWQSVLFLGYGDDRDLSNQNRLEKTDRQFFMKLSYAIQLKTEHCYAGVRQLPGVEAQ